MFDLIPFRNRKNRSMTERTDSFEDMVESFFNNFGSMSNMELNRFKTDIKENEDKYIVEAELPGIDKNNIDIELEDNYLTITAENNEVVEEEKDSYIRRERRSGKFQRCFYVKDINQDEIEANFDNGILELKLPKENPGTNRRKIDIN